MAILSSPMVRGRIAAAQILAALTACIEQAPDKAGEPLFRAYEAFVAARGEPWNAAAWPDSAGVDVTAIREAQGHDCAMP
jgi:hypothetical protein